MFNFFIKNQPKTLSKAEQFAIAKNNCKEGEIILGAGTEFDLPFPNTTFWGKYVNCFGKVFECYYIDRGREDNIYILIGESPSTSKAIQSAEGSNTLQYKSTDLMW